MNSTVLVYQNANWLCNAAMSKIKKTRYLNLLVLLQEVGAAELARKGKNEGIAASHLSQIKNRIKTPGGTERGVGDKLAADLETAAAKEQGWMDTPHPELWAKLAEVKLTTDEKRLIEGVRETPPAYAIHDAKTERLLGVWATLPSPVQDHFLGLMQAINLRSDAEVKIGTSGFQPNPKPGGRKKRTA